MTTPPFNKKNSVRYPNVTPGGPQENLPEDGQCEVQPAGVQQASQGMLL